MHDALEIGAEQHVHFIPTGMLVQYGQGRQFLEGQVAERQAA